MAFSGMAFTLFVLVLLFLCYAVMILYYRSGWNHLDEFILDKSYMPKTKVSIIIPARNEEHHIGYVLKDVLSQYYPDDLMEVIVVDDHSTDRTAEIIQSFKGVRYMDLSLYTGNEILNSYKKKAIETAIKHSTGELIVTTDADCRMNRYWLLSIVSYYEKTNSKLIAAPVDFTNDGSWFQTFQSIDFMSMQGITGAVASTHSATMCNGANLAYTRQAFDTVNGFKGIDDIASGDDMLLMYKIEQRFPRKTNYIKCKEAIAKTEPMDKPASFINQRIRWASKASHFKDKRITLALGLVYIYNLSFVVLLLLSLYNPYFVTLFLSSLLAKIGLELALAYPVSQFFNKEKELLKFPLLQFLHIPYIIFSGMVGAIGTYTWKDRKVK
jgi:cellulose synthase/poly-beta-1,6-N-acetylglucosamine synthase-like glycosyltransferase